MKFKKACVVLPLLSVALIGCNNAGLNRHNITTVPAFSNQYDSIFIYKTRAELPKNTKITGIARVQNYYPNGVKVSPEIIIEELKKQAALVGGNGLVHITPGTAQTTADIVFIR